MANGFKHAADFAVASLGNRNFVPAVSTFSTTGFYGAKLGNAIFKRHPFKQAFLLFIVQSAQHPHCVFTLQAKTRMHQLIGQLARTRQQQQTFGIQIQSANRLPFALKQLGQAPEHGWPVLRIIVRHDLSSRFMVGNHARRRWVNPDSNGLAVHLDGIAELDALTDMRGLGIDRNTPLQNELLHFKPRTQSSLRQHFVKFGGFRLRRQHTFWQIQRDIFFVSIKFTRDHILKTNGGLRRFRAPPIDAGWNNILDFISYYQIESRKRLCILRQRLIFLIIWRSRGFFSGGVLRVHTFTFVRVDSGYTDYRVSCSGLLRAWNTKSFGILEGYDSGCIAAGLLSTASIMLNSNCSSLATCADVSFIAGRSAKQSTPISSRNWRVVA